MIDYTQYAFRAPPQVIDPIPTVSDYLDDYTARDEAWYQSWAYPLEGGGYGSRPSSFERRAPFIPIPDPIEDPTPPVLRSIDPVTGESYGMGATGQEDRPAGALVRDVGDMSVPDLFAEYEAGIDPIAPYAASVPSALLSAAVPGLGLVGGAMARNAMENRSLEVLGAMLAQDASAAVLPNLGMISRVGTPTVSEAPGRDVIDQLVLGGSTTPDQGLFARVGTPSYVPEPGGGSGGGGGYSSADRSGRDETTSQRGGLGGV